MLSFNAANFKIHLIKKYPIMVCVNGKDSKQQVIPQTGIYRGKPDEEASLWQRELGIKY